MKQNYFKNINYEKMDCIKHIGCNYKIVEKKETRALRYLIDKCKSLENGFSGLGGLDISEEEYKTTLVVVNKSIIHHLNKLFNYYARNYGVELEIIDGNSELLFIDVNIGEICIKIKSWEK